MNPKYICALICVTDIQKSKDFYTRFLGQEVEYDFGENVSFKGGLAIHDVRHFAGLTGAGTIANPARKEHMEIYFEFDEVKEIEKKVKEAGYEIVHETKEQPWRQLVFRFYDPDGYIIEIGEPLQALVKRLKTEGMNNHEICEATGLDEGMVKHFLSL